jgi:hypothetical protein
MQDLEEAAGVGGVPEGSTIHTFLIYDAQTGEVVHGHKVLVLPDVETPSEEELHKQALDVAAEVTKRPAGKLKALKVEDKVLKPGHLPHVDPKSGKLEQHEPREQRGA